MDSDDASAANHERYMRRCIELARIAQGRNNTPVGSVVVINGEIVGEGIEELPTGTNITGHAEVFAYQDAINKTASTSLSEAALYTTAEPCFMCSYIIRECRIGLVVYGIDTPEIGGVTSIHPILTDTALSAWRPAPRILGGILESECRSLRSPQNTK